MSKMRPRASLVPLLLVFIALPVIAQAPYPARNVQIIVPYTAGGSIDIMTRAVAQQLTVAWGKNVVVDNRPGASGMIGTEIATKAEPDGHVLLGHTSSYPATAAVREKLPFDPARAIVPVAMIARAPMMVAIHPSVPAKTVKELVALAKKDPGDSSIRRRARAATTISPARCSRRPRASSSRTSPTKAFRRP